MVRLSSKLNGVRGSLTLAVGENVAKLRSAGVKLHNMSLGEPCEPVHPRIQEAVSKDLRKDGNKYTLVAGMPKLREAIAESASCQDGVTYTKENVIVTPGTKGALYFLLTAALNPGEKVIMPAPYWSSYCDMVKLLGGEPVQVNCAFEDDLLLAPEVLQGAITEDTTWLVLNSPVNPSGMVYTKERLQALGKVLKNHPHVNVIWDDVYKNLTYEGEFCSLVQAVPELKDRVFITGGVSKSHAMTGLRLGWCVGDSAVISAMVKIQSHAVTCACSISQIAAIEALRIEKEGGMTEFVESYNSRMLLALEFFNQIEGLRFLKPKGAFYFYVFVDSYINKSTPDGKVIKTDDEIAQYLLNEAKLVSLPGSAFSMSPAIRISYTCDKSTIEAGLTSMKNALGKLS